MKGYLILKETLAASVPIKTLIFYEMTNKQPLVSVICLCYNHGKYVVEAMESVLNQTYQNVELIVVDDASQDESASVIKNFLKDKPEIQFIQMKENVGNCKAFNEGWQASSGKYIIDFAADDLMLSERITVGVESFTTYGDCYGVHFTDTLIIDAYGKKIREHNTSDFFGGRVPEGYLFRDLLGRYFINPVTMMYSRALLDYLGGYDESLAYEDFDLWVRSSKKFKYCYSNEVLMAKRMLEKSHSKQQYKPGSKILASTYKVCLKAYTLCEDKDDYQALIIRLKYEIKMAIISLNWTVAFKMDTLRRKTNVTINALKS
jgi:glycosyltransferase involved in cell wall biosynthesis